MNQQAGVPTDTSASFTLGMAQTPTLFTTVLCLDLQKKLVFYAPLKTYKQIIEKKCFVNILNKNGNLTLTLISHISANTYSMLKQIISN